jgi:peptidoglycan/LPS O-acetylase OafA/YrhL
LADTNPSAPALTPPPGNPRFPLLDSLRGVAAGMIVIVHAAGQSYGLTSRSKVWTFLMHFDVGVALFFLISGFLLYRPFVAARFERRPPIRIRDYARRRVLRIVPAYWVALTLLAIWPGLTGLWGPGWWRYYAFGQVYSQATQFNGDPPAWSLCIEVTFYLALPFLAVLLARLARQPRESAIRRELIALALLAVASIALQATLFSPSSSLPSLTLPSFIDWFAYGMMLAVLSVAWRGREHEAPALRLLARRPWLPWLAFLVVFWFLSTQLGLPRNPFAGMTARKAVAEHFLLGACAALLLLPALFCDTAGGWPRRLLAAPTLAWFGLVSYGVFLYHGPLIAPIRQAGADQWLPGSRMISLTIVALAASTTLAAASYFLVERPILRFKERRGPPGTRPGAKSRTTPAETPTSVTTGA